MSENDVFSSEGESKQEQLDPLHQLVGEGRKFETLEDLAKGKLESDKFIEQLQGEMKTLREQMAEAEAEATKRSTVSDLVDAVKKANKVDEGTGNQSVSEEQLQEMVTSIMDGKHEKQTRLANYQAANQSVLDKFNGDVEAARTYTTERARQLGLTTEKLKALGEESPSAFKQLMDVKPSTGSQSTLGIPEVHMERGSNPARQEVVDGHHTKAYYDNLKKELGLAKYWNDPKIQGAYYKDALALGDRFKT
jgi:uncharacterized coiled-coil protein SlyX